MSEAAEEDGQLALLTPGTNADTCVWIVLQETIGIAVEHGMRIKFAMVLLSTRRVLCSRGVRPRDIGGRQSPVTAQVAMQTSLLDWKGLAPLCHGRVRQ